MTAPTPGGAPASTSRRRKKTQPATFEPPPEWRNLLNRAFVSALVDGCSCDACKSIRELAKKQKDSGMVPGLF